MMLKLTITNQALEPFSSGLIQLFNYHHNVLNTIWFADNDLVMCHFSSFLVQESLK